MVTTVATLLIVFAAADGPGPIAASIARHAADAAPQTAQVGDDASWARLSQATRGTEVVVSTKTVADVRRVFVGHDESSVTVLDLGERCLPRTIARQLRSIAEAHPDWFETIEAAGGFVDRDVRVDSTGIYSGSQRVCEVERVVERVPREQVMVVKRIGEAHASPKAVAGLAAAGFLVGLVTLAGASECRIAESLTGCRLELFAPLWMPVAGGVLGYVVTRHVDETVYYRRD